VFVTIDGQLIAVALLAARAGDRPFTLRAAIIRARQVFWRMVGGAFMAGIASAVVQGVLTLVLFGAMGASEGLDFFIALVAVILVAPLGYLATAIVIGDVGPWEALVRSVRLARARPSIAFVVALFTLVTAGIQFFALSAGLDLLIRVGEFFHVGLDAGPVALVLVVVLLLAFVVAFGSLTFTISAIVAAPQVAAFLGLTFYSAGLDRALEAGVPGSPPARGFRWVTLPMSIAIVVLALGSAGGIALVGVGTPRSTGPIAELIETVAPGHHPFLLDGDGSTAPDLYPEPAGGPSSAADLTEAELAVAPVVPDWLVAAFDCALPEVACGSAPIASAFSDGAVLVRLRLDAPPGGAPDADRFEIGAIFEIRGHQIAGAGSEDYARASHVVLTRFAGPVHDVHLLRFRLGGFQEVGTSARSRWVGANLLVLIPFTGDFRTDPIGWGAASLLVGGNPRTASRDRIAASNQRLLPIDEPQVLYLEDPFASFEP
jgi:hypothetical protein